MQRGEELQHYYSQNYEPLSIGAMYLYGDLNVPRIHHLECEIWLV